jgi:ferredoxin
MNRKIIEIIDEKCDGCGQCIPECPEGAIQIIDGKARLISDLFCDGLGACIGHCPTGAINVIEREARAYDERRVMENVVRQGQNTVRAHLKHLHDHGELDFLQQAVAYLEEHQLPIPELRKEVANCAQGPACPGSQNSVLIQEIRLPSQAEEVPSALSHWPIQMHLVSPLAPQFAGSDLILAADCVAFSMGNFHQKFLPDKTLTIACPKLDQQQQIYLEKLKVLINEAKINSLTVMIMQVPCCRGLLILAQEALKQSKRKIPIKMMMVGVQGEILQDQWVA